MTGYASRVQVGVPAASLRCLPSFGRPWTKSCSPTLGVVCHAESCSSLMCVVGDRSAPESGDKKNNKHKQLCGIVPDMDGGQTVYVFPLFLGKKGNT